MTGQLRHALTLTRVGPDYAGQLALIQAETFEQAYGSLHSADNIRAYCGKNFTTDAAEAALSDPDVTCKVALRGDKAVGFYLIKQTGCPLPVEGRCVELKQIYLLPEEYGSGLGKLFFDDAIRVTRDSGAACVWLMVSDLNHRARRFYRQRHFQQLGAGPVIKIGTDRLPSSIMTLYLEY